MKVILPISRFDFHLSFDLERHDLKSIPYVEELLDRMVLTLLPDGENQSSETDWQRISFEHRSCWK